jgi:autoinducer 2-degrading protein
MAFSVWVELEVAPGKLEEFLAGITANQAATLAEPGCKYFDVVRLEREGQWFGFYEIYENADAFHKEHKSYPHYLSWRDVVAATVVPGSQQVTSANMQIASNAN